jgi:hypothetical protein
MEFKGTKEFKVKYLTTMDFPYKYVVSSIQETDEEAEANALLISKAPEMLNKLIYVIDTLKGFDSNNPTQRMIIEEYEQLIKEATEI